MGKPKKKLSKRFKRTIGFSLSSLFLISAVIVALIPDKGVEAYTTSARVYLDDTENMVPDINASDIIYTTGDGMFQFVFTNNVSGNNKVAMICGYDFARSLQNQGTLTIPKTVDAYRKFTDSQGSFGGYVAVNKSDEFLYYPMYDKRMVDEDGDGNFDKDANGDYIYEDYIKDYSPCYFSAIQNWYYDRDGSVRDPKNYYYIDSTSSATNPSYIQTTDEMHQRVVDAAVQYIANQYVEKDATTGDWALSSDTQNGIFSKARNIQHLVIEEDSILGIGNNAFKNCVNLSSVSFGNGLNTVGNYAFSGCLNLKEVSIPNEASVIVLGEHAFSDCHMLEEFTVPTGLEKIGDSCFENCMSMRTCNLVIPGKSSALSQMGDNVFKGCSSLEHLEYPALYNENQDVAWYEGCTSLKSVKVPYSGMKFFDSNTFTFEDFKNQLPEEFYFEGVPDQKLHTDVCTPNSIAFKYIDEEVYEKVFTASGSAGSGQTVYHVNNNNELTYFYMDDTVKEVNIPGTIGPYQITKIADNSFQNNEVIEKINIPSSITEISPNAFKGCYNLKDVIFDEPINLTYIGEDAFDTQGFDNLLITGTPPTNPVLTFTGVASLDSKPFEYAMNKNNNVNNPTQPKTYITFYTGWPSNQTIRYNPDTDDRELIEVPTKTFYQSLSLSSRPYLTNEMIAAGTNAFATPAKDRTEYQDQIVDSALNIEVPEGITSIKGDLFSEYDEVTGLTVNNNDVETITTYGIHEIKDYQFAGMTNLKGVYLNDNCERIGDYAFKGCTSLVDVDVNSPLEEFGVAPFMDCDSLEDVYFDDTSDFYCKDAIIYNGINGSPYLLEVLPTRGLPKANPAPGEPTLNGTRSVSSDELKGVIGIAPSAFENCDGVYSVDFKDSKVEEIPENCFKNTLGLSSAILNDGLKKICKDAFKNSNIGHIEIPKSCAVIDNSAFDGTTSVEVYCESDAPARSYVEGKPNMSYSEKPTMYTISFFDDDTMQLIGSKDVIRGTNFDVEDFKVPKKDGYHFVKFKTSGNLSNVQENISVNVVYEPEDGRFEVTFLNWNGDLLYTEKVAAGEDCQANFKDPKREGYTFAGWLPEITNITANKTVIAQFEKDDNTNIPGSKEDPKKEDPGKEDPGKTDPNNNNGNNNQNNAKLYTVTVVGGSGSGSYVEGASVIICANNPENGKVFDKWTHDAEAKIAKEDIAASYFFMPAKDVTVTATYKEDTTKKNETNNSGNNNNNAQTATKPNTTVTLTKTGFSNNGLASATVAGSSDNFVLKITDSQSAKAEIEDALLAEYGTLDNIKYVAMDISLYDSTGAAKIKNTEDLSVSITLPIPDDLLSYAGNNKAAYVVNGKLVKLNPKFTTINGVPCINFVAPHFSPYTIYVDTTDLSSSVSFTPNSTPKTGDGIGVKWIVSIGLLAMSVLFFALCLPTGKKKKA